VAGGGAVTGGVFRNDERRFWERTRWEGECRVWIGTRHPKGYGQIRYRGVQRKTHRLAWEFANGPIPSALHVLHHCDNPPCVRPSHLYLGTNADNVRDRERRRRHPHEIHPVHCKLTEELVRDLRAHKAATGHVRDWARLHGVNRMTAQRAATGKSWIHVT